MKCIKSIFSISLLFFVYNTIIAQVPVMKEPHHKPVLVNNYVRLLDVHINAKDTTQYHIHASPSVIVMISHSIIGSQKLGEAPSTPNEVFPAQTSYVDYGKNPITHRVFNAGDSIFHVMDIELVKKEPLADSTALTASNFETTINEKLVRVYKFNVDANKTININKSNCAHLLVCINGEITSNNKTIKTGGYIFFNAHTSVSTKNKSNSNASCILLELK